MIIPLGGAGRSIFSTGSRITVPLQVGRRGTLLNFFNLLIWTAAFPYAVGDCVDGFFIFYGFHILPRFRAAMAQLK